MASVFQIADLTGQGTLVVLKLPLSSKRLDVLRTRQAARAIRPLAGFG